MVNTRKGQAKPKNETKTDSLSEKNEMLEQLKVLLAAETEKIENSNKRKFDDIAEKLQSMGTSIAKISKTDDDEKKILSNNRSNEKPESAKQFVLKEVFDYDVHLSALVNVHLNYHEGYLEFRVYCDPIDPVKDEWSIDAKLEFKMIEADNINKSVIRTLECCFDDDNNTYGYEDFMKWYYLDDKFTVEVKVKIIKMTGFEREKLRLFDESQNDVSDMILVVQDTKFYVSKTYLAAQSPFFKALFFGNFAESNMSEIPLIGIEPADFQLYLEALYGEDAIHDSTVEVILHVAHMYDTHAVLRRCENFLLKESKQKFNKKLQMSTKYRLENLKNQCHSGIKKLDDYLNFSHGNLDDLDPSVGHNVFMELVTSQKIDRY